VGWYPARYAGGIGSILGTDDITSHIPAWENDVVILEEPEHLNWYRNGPRWTTRFNHVVGVGHTNYEAYASTEPTREGRASIDVLAERVFTETVTRAHCDVVLQLSATLRPLPHSRVCNVHGVREVFLAIGEQKPYARREFQEGKAAPCYFLGKALWAKGYDQLLLLLASADLTEIYAEVDAERLALRTAEDEAFPNMKFLESFVPQLAAPKANESALPAAMPILIDCFGNGPDIEAIEAKSAELCAPLSFKGAADHALDSVFGAYDVFVNPSISEVLCTATAEALAMGKRVVISRHPSNEFFYDFERCHTSAAASKSETDAKGGFTYR
jgi:digalactosyldiacylglycerol synthase